MKIGNIIKKLKKIFAIIHYCNRCSYYIAESDVLKNTDICGYTIRTRKNEIGKILAVTKGDQTRCPECGRIDADNRKIAYQKCERKNKKFKCLDFKFKGLQGYLINIIKYIYRKLQLFNSYVKKNMMVLVTVWILFHVRIMISVANDEIIDIDTTTLIMYVIISIWYFIYAIKKAKS